MNNFINWCNDNQGFLTLILTFFTILVSVIAICVSIRAAKLPYKKQIKLAAKYTYGVSTEGLTPTPLFMELYITNVGHFPIGIESLSIGLILKHKLLKLSDTIKNNFDSQIIEPSNLKSIRIDYRRFYNFFMEELDQKRIKRKQTLYIYAVDYEGKNYLKKFSTVEKFMGL